MQHKKLQQTALETAWICPSNHS